MVVARTGVEEMREFDDLEMEEDAVVKSHVLDVLYAEIDGLLRVGKFDVLDAKLRVGLVDLLSTDELLTVLTATAPARDKLRERASFLARAEAEIVRRGEMGDGLLDGLR